MISENIEYINDPKRLLEDKNIDIGIKDDKELIQFDLLDLYPYNSTIYNKFNDINVKLKEEPENKKEELENKKEELENKKEKISFDMENIEKKDIEKKIIKIIRDAIIFSNNQVEKEDVIASINANYYNIKEIKYSFIKNEYIEKLILYSKTNWSNDAKNILIKFYLFLNKI